MSQESRKNNKKESEAEDYPDFLKVAEEIKVENPEDPVKARERMAEEYGKRV